MISVADVLAAGGLEHAADIAPIARSAGLELAAAATVLAMESGGRNVWGHDPVDTGGAYVKGGEVTRANYCAYRALVEAGKIGRQGCGPLQLTWGPLQRAADQRGGCWRWESNAAVGFEHLAAMIRAHGERAAFRRYNGSGAAAEDYAARAMARLVVWRGRLDSIRPTLRRGDTGPAVEELQQLLKVVSPREPGYGVFGPRTERAVRAFQSAHGLTADGIVGARTWGALLG